MGNNKVKKLKKHRRYDPLKKFAILLIIVSIISISILVFFRLEKVTIVGCEYYTEEEMKEEIISGIFRKNTLLIYLQYLVNKNRKSLIPMIQDYRIEMISTKELQIQVYEKPIIAGFLYMSSYVYFDNHGIIINSFEEPLDKIPLITGVNCKNMTIYEPILVDDEELFQIILELSEIISNTESLEVDRIHINYDRKVTLYIDDYKVLLGKSDSYHDQIAKLPSMLENARDKKHVKGVINMENYVAGDTTFYFTEE